jgi:hypothetical protein
LESLGLANQVKTCKAMYKIERLKNS